jgi:type VI protein secretion system component Hcp
MDDARGESTRVPNCSDVLAWSWGANSTFGSVAQTNLQDISLTKYADTASEDLLRLVVTRQPVKGNVEYSEYKDDCGAGCLSKDPYLTIHFKLVQLTSFSTGNSSGAGVATENVSMQFDAVSYCYRPTSDGELGAAQCTAWSKTTGTISPF